MMILLSIFIIIILLFLLSKKEKMTIPGYYLGSYDPARYGDSIVRN